MWTGALEVTNSYTPVILYDDQFLRKNALRTYMHIQKSPSETERDHVLRTGIEPVRTFLSTGF